MRLRPPRSIHPQLVLWFQPILYQLIEVLLVPFQLCANIQTGIFSHNNPSATIFSIIDRNTMRFMHNFPHHLQTRRVPFWIIPQRWATRGNLPQRPTIINGSISGEPYGKTLSRNHPRKLPSQYRHSGSRNVNRTAFGVLEECTGHKQLAVPRNVHSKTELHGNGSELGGVQPLRQSIRAERFLSG